MYQGRWSPATPNVSGKLPHVWQDSYLMIVSMSLLQTSSRHWRLSQGFFEHQTPVTLPGMKPLGCSNKRQLRWKEHRRSCVIYLCRNLQAVRVGLRPSALSYYAAISRVLEATELRGSAQLTLDDAIYYNRGMCIIFLVLSLATVGYELSPKQTCPSVRECTGTIGWSALFPKYPREENWHRSWIKLVDGH